MLSGETVARGETVMTRIEDYQLRPIGREDLATVLRWRNSGRIKALMYSDHSITLAEHRQWFQRSVKDPNRQALLLVYRNQPIGVVNFTNIDRENGRCEWGFYIGDETAPKGSGTIMGWLALDTIFNDPGMHKVCSEIIATNRISYLFHQKLGFVTEGRLADHVRKNNVYQDVIRMALFAEGWVRVRAAIVNDLQEREKRQG